MEIKTEQITGFKLWSDTIELIPAHLEMSAYYGDEKAKQKIRDIVYRNKGREALRALWK